MQLGTFSRFVWENVIKYTRQTCRSPRHWLKSNSSMLLLKSDILFIYFLKKTSDNGMNLSNELNLCTNKLSQIARNCPIADCKNYSDSKKVTSERNFFIAK